MDDQGVANASGDADVVDDFDGGGAYALPAAQVPHIGGLDVIPGLLESMSPLDMANHIYAFAKEVYGQSWDPATHKYRKTPKEALQVSADVFAFAFDLSTVMAITASAAARVDGPAKNVFLLACETSMVTRAEDDQ